MSYEYEIDAWALDRWIEGDDPRDQEPEYGLCPRCGRRHSWQKFRGLCPDCAEERWP